MELQGQAAEITGLGVSTIYIRVSCGSSVSGTSLNYLEKTVGPRSTSVTFALSKPCASLGAHGRVEESTVL